MSLKRRVERLEDGAPTPEEARPRYLTLLNEKELLEALPQGSQVARVVWGREDTPGGKVYMGLDIDRV